MLVVAIVSLGATVVDSADDQGRHRRAGAPPGPARAVGARRRGDGCRHLRGRAVVHPPLAGLPRDHGRRGRHPQGPLRAAADPADVVPRPLAVGPVAVANHERPEHDSPVHVVRHGLPDCSTRLQIAVVTGILLAMYWPLGVVVVVSIVPITLDGAALPAGVHPAVAAGAGPVRPRRHPCRGVRARRAGGQVVRPRATTPTTGSTSSSPTSTTRRCAGCRCRRSSGRCWRSSRT